MLVLSMILKPPVAYVPRVVMVAMTTCTEAVPFDRL